MSKFSKNRGEDRIDDDEDRPWSEERWEAFMKEGDLRAARFGELLETLRDDPDCDEKVAREMGWDKMAEALAEDKARTAEKAEAAADDDDDEPFDIDEALNDPDDDEDAEASEAAGDSDEDDAPVESIPAYVMATDVGERVWEALKPWLDRESDEDDPLEEPLRDAFLGIQIAGAKLAGGHGMGYSDHSLCGNIVCCRKALDGAEQSIRGLEALRQRPEIPRESVEPLLPEVASVRDAIQQRIDELREGVWW